MSSMSSVQAVPTSTVSVHLVPLVDLAESPTNPRKFFDAAKLDELAASIGEYGILEPLIARRRTKGEGAAFEVVCGARRYRAARSAGLVDVPVTIREFTDEEVRLIQLTENGARADFSPLEEAEAYAALAADGLDAAAVAKALGKKTREVAKRLPLAKLPKRVKDALAAGHIQVGHAELIGLIPDTKLQETALGRFLYDANESGGGKAILGAVPLALAKRIVEEEFMTALSLAVFDPEDAALSPLGACSKCPHLAGNNPDLFGDVAKKAVCTNPQDFALKTENHLKRLRESGHTVLLSKNELKRAFPFGASDQVGKEFIDLERTCAEDPKHRAYEELLGRAEKLRTVFALKNGRVRKLYPAKDMKAALIVAGHAFAKDKRKKEASGNAAKRSTANLETIGREAVSRELATRLRTLKLPPGGWIDLLLRIALVREGWKLDGVIRRHGFEGAAEEFAKNRERIISELIGAMKEGDRRAFLVDLLVGDWCATAGKAEGEIYKHLLKLAGVDCARVAKTAIETEKRRAAETKSAAKAPVAAKEARAK
jgi:ParB/RepB/Spo0J family partition protein